ncbi:MAG: DUF86 domain-containing protein [Bacteroidota bacterium]
MTEKAAKYLADVLRAIDLIEEFSEATPNFYAYQKDLKTKSAIERQLAIVGEAVNQYLKESPKVELSNARKIVDFRNRLIHSYDNVDDSMVWVVLKKHLPTLQQEIEDALS